MTSPQQWNNLIGMNAVDANGDKIGKVGQVYLDDETGQPAWVTVSTGMLGSRESFAPLHNSGLRDGQLVLAVPKQLIKDAPDVGSADQLTGEQADALNQHYTGYLARSGRHAEGEEQRRAAAGQGTKGAQQRRRTAGQDTDDAMTRSEERLRVDTENVEAGRARLRKYVVTENVSTTVPVSHEEVRLEREPVTDANRDAALSGPEISEQEHEVTLHAERPVVAKEAVPVERVRLGTETVTEEQQVNEEIRKEQIDDPDVDQDAGGRGR